MPAKSLTVVETCDEEVDTARVQVTSAVTTYVDNLIRLINQHYYNGNISACGIRVEIDENGHISLYSLACIDKQGNALVSKKLNHDEIENVISNSFSSFIKGDGISHRDFDYDYKNKTYKLTVDEGYLTLDLSDANQFIDFAFFAQSTAPLIIYNYMKNDTFFQENSNTDILISLDSNNFDFASYESAGDKYKILSDLNAEKTYKSSLIPDW